MHFQIKTMSHGKYSNRHFYTGHKIEKKIKRNAKHLHLNQHSFFYLLKAVSIQFIYFTRQYTTCLEYFNANFD